MRAVQKTMSATGVAPAKDAVKASALRAVATSGLPRRCRRSSRSEEHTSELQSRRDLVCRLLLEKKKKKELQQQLFPDLLPWPSDFDIGTINRAAEILLSFTINLLVAKLQPSLPFVMDYFELITH